MRKAATLTKTLQSASAETRFRVFLIKAQETVIDMLDDGALGKASVEPKVRDTQAHLGDRVEVR